MNTQDSEETLAWHYTTRLNLARILPSGVLLPAEAVVPVHERPVLWFSRSPLWEETACKSVKTVDGRVRRLTRNETRQLAGGLVRFGYPAHHLIAWPEIADAAGIQAETARALVAAAKIMGGNPEEWMGHLGAISLQSPTLCLEIEKVGNWTRVPRRK